MTKLIFHPEKPEQYRAMEALVRDAFWDRFSPGCREHLVVHKMRTSPAAVPELCLAAERGGELVGGIWYADAAIRHVGGETPVLTLGPVAVRTDLQGQGIGSALIRHTLKLASGRARAVVLYGAPAYYGRFGFRPAAEFGVTDPMGGECPALQILPMGGGVPAGAFDEGSVYAVTEDAVRAFDRTFPHRQKHLNSGQLFFAPPGPPPEDPVWRASRELRDRAEKLLRQSGLLEAWEAVGAKIRCVGSFRTDLMMKHRDIDLHVYTDTLDVPRSLKVMAPLLASPETCGSSFVNGAETDEHCLEWHWSRKDDTGNVWTLDVIQILARSRWDGFFEDTAEAVADALTPETRDRILRLKAAAPEDMKICGIEFCKAVLADRVDSWEGFLRWRENNPQGSLMTWRPARG